MPNISASDPGIQTKNALTCFHLGKITFYRVIDYILTANDDPISLFPHLDIAKLPISRNW